MNKKAYETVGWIYKDVCEDYQDKYDEMGPLDWLTKQYRAQKEILERVMTELKEEI